MKRAAAWLVVVAALAALAAAALLDDRPRRGRSDRMPPAVESF